jgi:hypothetical protein
MTNCSATTATHETCRSPHFLELSPVSSDNGPEKNVPHKGGGDGVPSFDTLCERVGDDCLDFILFLWRLPRGKKLRRQDPGKIVSQYLNSPAPTSALVQIAGDYVLHKCLVDWSAPKISDIHPNFPLRDMCKRYASITILHHLIRFIKRKGKRYASSMLRRNNCHLNMAQSLSTLATEKACDIVDNLANDIFNSVGIEGKGMVRCFLKNIRSEHCDHNMSACILAWKIYNNISILDENCGSESTTIT